MSGINPAEIQEFGPPTVENLQSDFAVAHLTACFNYAGVTLMLYDMLLTMQMEVRLLWRTKISFLKTAFLVNRYVSPVFICISIYFLSGLASGLTDSVRYLLPSLSPTYIFAALPSLVFSSGSDSNIIRGVYFLPIRLSTLGLVSSICAGLIRTITSVGYLSISRPGTHREPGWISQPRLPMLFATSFPVLNLPTDMIYEPLLNICITTAPVIWPQWLPVTIEHGIYALFMLFNAMATPRSERKAALAILYRDGIVFYMLTFLVCLGSLLVWGFAPRAYMGFGLYLPWIAFQVGISRLLLNVRTSQIFAKRGQAVDDENTILEGEISLRDVISPQRRSTNLTSCIVVSQDASNGRRDEGMGTGSDFPSIFKKDDPGKGSQEGDQRDSIGREIRRIHPDAGRLQTRFWWLWRRSETAHIHIDVMQTDNPGDSEWGESSTGGVKLSRLGRRDEWL